MEGTKTGFTNPAGYCFVGSCKRGGVELVGVVLGAKSNSGRFSQMRKLLNWGFAHTHVRRLVSAGATLGVEPVSHGVDTSVAVCASREASAAVLDGAAAPTFALHVQTPIAAPVSASEVVGTVDVCARGCFVESMTVTAARSVAAAP